MPGATTPPPTTDLLTPHGRPAALAASHCERFVFGTALWAPALPRVRDPNCVRFEHRDDALTGEDLVAIVDRVQAGGAHRWCEIRVDAPPPVPRGARARPHPAHGGAERP